MIINSPVTLSEQITDEIRDLLFVRYNIFITNNVMIDIRTIIITAIDDHAEER